MKTKNFFGAQESILRDLLLLTLLLVALAPPARGADLMLKSKMERFNTTNVLEAATNFIHNLDLTNAVELNHGRGLGLTIDLRPGGATNVSEHKFQLSPDGTLWNTNNQLVLNFNVATNMTWGTNLPASYTDNFRYLRYFSHGTVNTNKITNSVYWHKRFPDL